MVVNYIMDCILLSKTETNEILKYIREDNEVFGLLFDLIYIYARNVTEVSTIRKKDINLEDNTILFNINQNNTEGIFPIHKDIKKRLCKFMETDEEYIFKGYIPVHNPTGVLNDYLAKNNQKFKNLLYKNNVNLSLSTIDFKILRGQHLFQDGVDVESIHRLYHYKNLNSTKRIINYHGLIQHKDVDIDSLFNDYTDVNLFKVDEYKMYNQYYCSLDDKECIVVLDKITGEIMFNGDNSIKKIIHDFNFSSIKEYGDYSFYKKVQIMKI